MGREVHNIPEEHRAEIEPLAQAEDEAYTRVMCNDRLLDLAMDAGDADKAIVLKKEMRDLWRVHTAAYKALWDRLKLAVPHMNPRIKYTVNTFHWKISEVEGHQPPAQMNGRIIH